ncbi:ShlB/FhaC/HecB family hemolysin secretion/activation protein [Parvibaculum sp.]|uniref:ShlB/FhaC/HecB family hemolysin secretion/activation protein n=1 Tax=Parvibaculum sp. TaxID=2024848 RepID=UPI001DBC9D65|nr:ShlB/FhaC/HecB family hemolysin secretion/activation protein [Parvibaculum sp.]MBX3490635.1 ShlB/FhaC/HecB family hemolysin secretion/activation protein [Parvibaculum sp.]MCW5728539.1 ShlB/FhaC/HecB family hemolysin secretion/activation protein [Parvibaculum sp.]
MSQIAGLRCFAIASMVWLVPITAVAQVIPPAAQPGREHERFMEPRAPQVQPGPPVIYLPGTVAPSGADEVDLLLTHVAVEGTSVYGLEDIRPLYAEFVGRKVTLQTVYEIARRITARYGADGYVLARAIVPPQEIDADGASIRIEVIEGRIDKVVWPEELALYRDFFSAYARKIVAQRPANIRIMERYLLLANDLPGLQIRTALQASEEEAGASTLVVEVLESPIEVNARLDNRGTSSRGPEQFLASATFSNVAGMHEALTFVYAGALQIDELQYVAASYNQVLGSEGLALSVNASHSWGEPGTATLQSLDFVTRSTVVEAGLSYPVVRSRERNLTLTGLAFMNDNDSDVLGGSFNVDRLRGVRVRADADVADRWQGVSQFSLTFSQGIDGLGSTANGHPQASRAAGRVDFRKLEAMLGRTQPISSEVSAYAAAYALYGFDPLLVSEQCGFGGRFFGRAFDPSAIVGDRCLQLLGELRYDLPPVAAIADASTQIYGFADYGRVHTLSPAAGTPSSASAASGGAGLRLNAGSFNVDLTAAKAIDGPRNDWRFFFSVAMRY